MTQPTTLEQELTSTLERFREFARLNDSDRSITVQHWRNYDEVQLKEAKEALLSLFEKYATEIIGDNEHIQHFNFHGRSDIRDELRKEQTQRLKQILSSVRKDD